MTEEQILKKLKEYLGINYSLNDNGEEFNNLEDFIENIPYIKTNDDLYEMDNKRNLKFYSEFINYLEDKCCGDNRVIIEVVNNNTYNEFIDYVKVTKSIDKNKLILHFEVNDVKYKAEWQPSDNYGVWQTCGICGDDYSGYLLFPTYRDDEYFCMSYAC